MDVGFVEAATSVARELGVPASVTPETREDSYWAIGGDGSKGVKTRGGASEDADVEVKEAVEVDAESGVERIDKRVVRASSREAQSLREASNGKRVRMLKTRWSAWPWEVVVVEASCGSVSGTWLSAAIEGSDKQECVAGLSRIRQLLEQLDVADGPVFVGSYARFTCTF